MSLFQLDSVRNGYSDPAVELLLEEQRERLARAELPPDTDAKSIEEVLEVFDAARPRLNLIASHLKDLAGAHGADISTGLGLLPPVLRALGLRVTPTSCGSPSILSPREWQVRPYCLGRDPAPFAAESLEFVVFGEVLEHLKLPPIRALSETASLLRPGGRLILTTPNVSRRSHIDALVSGENFLEPFSDLLPLGSDPTDFIEHVREYSVREVVDAVEAVGLGVDNVMMTGWGVEAFEPAPNPFANDIIVLTATR